MTFFAPFILQTPPPIVIHHSVKMKPLVRRLKSSGGAVVLIEGNGITVDFGGTTLQGSSPQIDPDLRAGVGIEVRGDHVTIKNVKVSGYKVGLIARQCRYLKIENSDFSYNWKQHLHSTLDKEDESDWMSYHQNEKDEWLGYGAGMYLRGCSDFEIKGDRATGGQCGLMMTECNRGLIWNNDFSFLSGIGIGLYRSSNNRVMHNRVDWCVRGYSHGVYNRGQDSAGILIYEQSNHNTFAYNSVTHGGDGFFLWAGQTTMDTGKGGCNDNLLYGNDWSHAPTNGIEATFSRNIFADNLVLECWHGIWGGYSFETRVIGNVFGLNAEAIAWEHGQNNQIEQNVFYRDLDGIDIWANPQEDPNWGYGKARDTKSHGWTIENNRFSDLAGTAISIKQTRDATIKNRYDRVARHLNLGEDNSDIRFEDSPTLGTPTPATMAPSGNPVPNDNPSAADYARRFRVDWTPWPTGEPSRAGFESLAPKPLAGGMNPFLKPGTLRGRRYILVGEWGPYDFRSPVLWPREDDPVTHRRVFEILGPKGKWSLIGATGVGLLSPDHGEVPGRIEVELPKGEVGNMSIKLKYTGGKTTDFRGIETPAGQPVVFSYEAFFAPIDWSVAWFDWDPSKIANPQHAMPSLTEVLTPDQLAHPLRTEKTDRLQYAWGGSPGDPVPADHFMTLAEGTFRVQAGDYTIDLTTDDGARLYVDGKLAIDQWHYQGPTTYRAALHLDGSQHRIRVEHYEIDGYSTLKVELKPKS